MEKSIKFILNNEIIETFTNPALPLLDFIRKEKHLHGTKEVCKEGDCGACTVLLGTLEDNKLTYKSVTSCIYPIGNIDGRHVITIEGINSTRLTPPQMHFIKEGASQCGFCTPGFIMSLTGYLLNNDKYNFEGALNSISGNICRCTGYESIKRAVKNLIEDLTEQNNSNSQNFLYEKNIINFDNILNKLASLERVDNSDNINEKSIIGGGSDLFVQKADKLLQTETYYLNSLKLDLIEEKDEYLYCGGGVTFEQLKNSSSLKKYFPTLENKLNLVASLPIRNMASIAGNLVNASPIGDLTNILLALNAELILLDNSTRREISLNEFYLGYKNIGKAKSEIIEFIKIPLPKNAYYFNFEKVSKRIHLDIASVNSAIYLEMDDNVISKILVSAGGIAAIPKRLYSFESFLLGKTISEELVIEGLHEIQSDISPISDIRGSKDYKTKLLNQLIKAHFIELFPEKIKIEEMI